MAIEIEDDQDLVAEQKAAEDFPFVALDINRLENARRDIGCDIFLQRTNDKMTRIFSKDLGLDFKRLKQYMDKGVQEVWVRREDWNNLNQFLQSSPQSILDKEGATGEEIAKAIFDMADQSVTDFFHNVEITDKSLLKSKTVVRKMVEGMLRDPKLLAQLLKLARNNGQVLAHSLIVSIISMTIAKHSDNASERTLELCAMGGFLHDIGKSQISPEISTRYTGLSADQMKELRLHPRLGYRMLEKVDSISDEIRLIVLQHHEQPDGGGYPDGIRGPKIFLPAKIVGIADAFAALTDPVNGTPFTVEEALSELGQNVGKFDRQLVEVAEKLFRSRKV